jgi:hypothetical protein
VIREPVKTPDRMNQGRGHRPISGPGARDGVPFFLPGHYERDIAAAIERRIGQRDTWLRFCADDSDRPPLALPQRRLTREQ